MGAEAVSMAEEPLSDQSKKEGLYRKMAFCIKVMGRCVIELTALEAPFLTKMAEVVAALEAQKLKKPYKSKVELLWGVSCPTCLEVRTRVGNQERAEAVLAQYAWHKDDCAWMLRQVALSGL